jgi:hypothetical protein
VAKAVIQRPLLTVAKNGVGLGALLELLLGFRIVRIAVGMVLQRKLAIRAFNFLLGGGARDPKYLVIVAFYVTGQNSPFYLSSIR